MPVTERHPLGGSMPSAVPGVITGYFEADASGDTDAIVALLTDDAVVVDEGHTYRGLGEIRGWREGPASEYQYTTKLSSTARTGPDEYLVTGSLTGNFPGGTATLRWRFTVAGGLIQHLHIAP
jgi:ketosteroid isomerase-like protein